MEGKTVSIGEALGCTERLVRDVISLSENEEATIELTQSEASFDPCFLSLSVVYDALPLNPVIVRRPADDAAPVHAQSLGMDNFQGYEKVASSR